MELGGLLLDQGEPAAAGTFFRRAIELDPLLESAHRGLMRSEVRQGEPARALRQYATLRQALATELGAAPAPGTRALARRIKELSQQS
jgi:DNA-binding SARP family transcriptional activator